MQSIDGCKFITVKDLRDDIITLIFDPYYVHDEMYKKYFNRTGIISAGFIMIDEYNDGKIFAHGKSTSISENPSATEQDTANINEWIVWKDDKNK